MTHICVVNISKKTYKIKPPPSHYLNQCWNIVNWTLGNKFQLNFHQNTTILIEENAFENVIWRMAAILCILLMEVDPH